MIDWNRIYNAAYVNLSNVVAEIDMAKFYICISRYV